MLNRVGWGFALKKGKQNVCGWGKKDTGDRWILKAHIYYLLNFSAPSENLKLQSVSVCVRACMCLFLVIAVTKHEELHMRSLAEIRYKTRENDYTLLPLDSMCLHCVEAPAVWQDLYEYFRN